MSVSRNDDADGLRALLTRLRCFKVLVWGGASSSPDLTTDREMVDIGKADVVSSLHNSGSGHALVIDIDHPSWLVRSTTPGHFHLYVDVPGGITDAKYRRLLGALADAGVVERGYYEASVARGHSDVRLPWIKKGATP